MSLASLPHPSTQTRRLLFREPYQHGHSRLWHCGSKSNYCRLLTNKSEATTAGRDKIQYIPTITTLTCISMECRVSVSSPELSLASSSCAQSRSGCSGVQSQMKSMSYMRRLPTYYVIS